MTLESRIKRLEARPSSAKEPTGRFHLVYVDDCRLDDDAHNEAAKRRALAANPPPEGARAMFILFVAPKKYGSSDEP